MTVIPVGHENLDAAAAPAVGRAVAAALADGPVVVDLSRTRFADSAGLGLLVRLARKHPGGVYVAGVTPPLQACLDRVGTAPLPDLLVVSPAPPPAPPHADATGFESGFFSFTGTPVA